MCFNFFKKPTRDENYYKLGGPRSFHQFKYKNKSIILIGEVHEKMPSDLANQYKDIVNQFVENSPSVSLYLEISDTEIEAPSSEGLGFIRTMQNLTPSPKLEKIPADKRDSHNKGYDGFLDFFCFLNKLAEIEEQITNTYKEKHCTPPTPIPFFQGQDFFNAVTKVGDLYEKNYYFSDLYQFLDSSIKILDALADKYADQNKQVARLHSCLSSGCQ